MNMPNGTIFIDVGEDPDAFGMHESGVAMVMPPPQLQNFKMENVGVTSQPILDA